MLKYASRVGLEVLLQQLAKVPLARRAMHEASLRTQGPSVVILRCHRLLPDDDEGRLHHHAHAGLSLTPRQLAEILGPIQQHLPFVHLAEALEVLAKKRHTRQTLAVLTFDESYQTSAELAAPLCAGLNIPACFFVTTHPSSLWHDQIHCLLEDVAPHPVSLPWMDRVLRTYSTPKRRESSRRLLSHLARYSETQRKERLKELLALRNEPLCLPKHDTMLTTKHIGTLRSNPYFSFASHGHRHLPLASLEPELLEEELAKPRQILKQCAGASYVDALSYPYGFSEHLSEEVAERAAALGYRAAFTAIKGVACPGDDLFNLPRLRLTWPANPLHTYELQELSRVIDEHV